MEKVAGSKRKRDDTDSEADVEAPSEEELDPNEIRAELHELARPRRSKRQRTANHTDSEIVYEQPRALRRRETQKPNYNLLPAGIFEEDAASDGGALRPDRPATRNGGARGPQRSLFDMSGPFGGNVIGSTTLKYGPDAARPEGPRPDDSSDDEGQVMPPNAHNIGVAPLTPPRPEGPRQEDEDAADITPVEVPTDISLDSVGGLDDHINKLKEMVMLPLLYPELYSKWKIPPPRGVLFHGPPGTGKTLLARALASSVSTGEQKVTFYMRKGSDVMSKWVGEAERQLRLLFEEAKKNQPAIIFFDEFDGKITASEDASDGSRIGSLALREAGADSRFHRLDAPRPDGWNGQPRTGCRHRRDQSTGQHRPGIPPSRALRQGVLLPRFRAPTRVEGHPQHPHSRVGSLTLDLEIRQSPGRGVQGLRRR